MITLPLDPDDDAGKRLAADALRVGNIVRDNWPAVQAAFIPRVPDFYVENHGSIVILNPITPDCIAWVEANVGDEETQHWGKHGVVIEPRYLDSILEGLRDAGFRS